MADLDAALAKLDSAEWSVRVEAARELAAFSDARALDGLTRALYDPEDSAVTEAAMESLLSLASDEALTVLIEALDSDDEEAAVCHLYSFLSSNASPLASEVLLRYESGGRR